MVAEIQGVAAAALQRHSNAASGRLDGVNERALTTARPRTCDTGAHFDCLDCCQTSPAGVVAELLWQSSDEATLLRFFSFFFAVILVSSDSLLCVLLIMCFSN